MKDRQRFVVVEFGPYPEAALPRIQQFTFHPGREEWVPMDSDERARDTRVFTMSLTWLFFDICFWAGDQTVKDNVESVRNWRRREWFRRRRNRIRQRRFW